MKPLARQFVFMILALPVAVLADAAFVPVMLNGRAGPHFTAALVVVVGLRRGPFWGLGVGWVAALLRGALAGGPLGIAMLSLGLVGLIAGILRTTARLGVVLIDALVALGLIFLEEILAGVLAWAAYGAPLRPGLVAVLTAAAAATLALAVWPPDEKPRPAVVS